MIGPEQQRRFRALVEAAGSTVLTTHVNPDGDALGSQLSLARFLLGRGRRVRLVNQDPTPALLRFVEDDALVVEPYDAAEHDAALREADLVVLVDNSAPDRLGSMEPIMREVAGRTLCVDHHPVRDMPWAHPIIDESSCATAVMIYELTRACGWQPDQRAAEALYLGLATDTGFFRFNSTNAHAHAVAADLLRLGVQPARVYQVLHERNSAAFTRLLGHALVGLRLDAEGAVASVRITRAQLRALGAEHEDTTEITTALLAMERTQVALLFRELADGRIKVSLRSKGGLDVHRLASEFGGGGHRNASGIVMAGELDPVVERVTGRAAALLASGG